nr:MAG TPA: hypothetical protein [Caudoviricetes sp.]
MEGVAEKQGARSPVCIVISSSPMHALPKLFPFIGRGGRKTAYPFAQIESQIFQKSRVDLGGEPTFQSSLLWRPGAIRASR